MKTMYPDKHEDLVWNSLIGAAEESLDADLSRGRCGALGSVEDWGLRVEGWGLRVDAEVVFVKI